VISILGGRDIMKIQIVLFVSIVLTIPWSLASQPIAQQLAFTKTSRIDEAVPPSIKGKHRIALFDTHRRCSYAYQPLINGAKTVNIHIDYHSIDAILDTPLSEIPLHLYDGALFALCPEFLRTMHGLSPVSKKILSIMDRFSNYPEKLTILMLPSMPPQRRTPLANLAYLLKHVGLSVTPRGITLENDPHYSPRLCSLFFNTGNNFLQSPLEFRSFSYHTTLQNPRKGRSFQYVQSFHKARTPIAFLPIKQHYPSPIRATLPYGIYWFNPARKNHLMISNTSLLTFAGISENFKLCPLDYKIRVGLMDALHETLWEISMLLSQKNRSTEGLNIEAIYKKKKPKLPHSIKMLGKRYSKSYAKQNARNRKIAWMEVWAFADSKNKKQQDELITYILDSKMQQLWLSISPNIFYSPIAREKHLQPKVITALSAFTKQLSEATKKRGLPLPEILIGFEIVNNIHNENHPKLASQDLYGNTYFDIPRPLNKEFWNSEVKIPLQKLLHDWKNPIISHGVKIRGIVLDLEMYGRKTTSEFLPTMGFDQATAIATGMVPRINTGTPHELVTYLAKNRKTKRYYLTLERKAAELGEELQSFVQKEIPNGIVCCYAPNISTDWFYKGFYKGLSSKKHPLHLFTFNAEFYIHRDWLRFNKIQAKHASVLMLSKLQTPEDFKWVDYVLQRHDGIWLNRFSRMAEPYKNDWAALERTPLGAKHRSQLAKYIGTK
jgi:hypothetical protein